MSANWAGFYGTMSSAELAEWRMAALTDAERANVETYRGGIESARATMSAAQFVLKVQTNRASMTNGTIARMKGAPRQEVIDAMIAVLDTYRGK